MISFLEKLKMLIKQYDLLPKLLSILLAVILWANLQNSQIDEISYHIYPEIRNLPQDYIILEDIQKLRITLRGKKEYIKSVNIANIKLYIDLSNPVIGKSHEYTVRLQHNDTLSNIEYLIEKDKLSITVCKLKNKSVPVEPVIIGELLPQYKKGQIIVEPPLVQVSGPDIVVDSVKSVKTYSVNIEKEIQTIHVPVNINVKEFSKLNIVPSVVTLTIPIINVSNLVHFAIPIEIKNKKNGLNYDVKIKKVNIYVKKYSHNIETIENLFSAYINGDLQTNDEGAIHLPVIVEKKSKIPFEIFTYEPSEVEVFITNKQ
ncbi:MAG: CdaR family protein [Spirochaetes bacterium]|nr:CdaR family protein [Spirochaetota bacterium]